MAFCANATHIIRFNSNQSLSVADVTVGFVAIAGVAFVLHSWAWSALIMLLACSVYVAILFFYEFRFDSIIKAITSTFEIKHVLCIVILLIVLIPAWRKASDVAATVAAKKAVEDAKKKLTAKDAEISALKERMKKKGE